MVSTTSGTTSFNMDVDEIISDALEDIGGEYQTASEVARARRVLNLILLELQNRNIPLSKLGFESLTLVTGDGDYTLPSTVNNVLDVNYKDSSGVETPLKGYGVKRWHQISNKTQQGRPSIYFVDKNNSGHTLRVWQVPSSYEDGNTLVCLVSYFIEDADASYQKLDIPTKYLPFVVKWLAYEMSLKRTGIDPQKRIELKQRYLESMETTFDEDRERVDFRIKPKL